MMICQILLRNIFWSDEAAFHIIRFINRPNCHYYSGEDHLVIYEKVQNRPKVTVQCGMTSGRIVDPFIFPDVLNAERYYTILQDEIQSVISDLEHIEDLIFIQDGAYPYFAILISESPFTRGWMGYRGPYEWPARGPDLIYSDFFLGGLVKGASLLHKTTDFGRSPWINTRSFVFHRTRDPGEISWAV